MMSSPPRRAHCASPRAQPLELKAPGDTVNAERWIFRAAFVGGSKGLPRASFLGPQKQAQGQRYVAAGAKSTSKLGKGAFNTAYLLHLKEEGDEDRPTWTEFLPTHTVLRVGNAGANSNLLKVIGEYWMQRCAAPQPRAAPGGSTRAALTRRATVAGTWASRRCGGARSRPGRVHSITGSSPEI